MTVDLSTIELAPDGPDRVRVSGTRGLAPPPQLKVCVNELGGFRNQMEFVLTGLDIEEKAGWLRAQLDGRIEAGVGVVVDGPAPAARLRDRRGRLGAAALRGQGRQRGAVGKPFTAAGVELALASYPGFTLTAPPGAPSPYGIYRPAYVDRDVVEHTVHLPDGSTEVVPIRRWREQPDAADEARAGHAPTRSPASPTPQSPDGSPLGTFVHARSGDKGGDANVGLWVRAGEKRRAVAVAAPVRHRRPPPRLLPEAKDLDVEVFELPNLHGVNVLVHGLLGDGVAASTRFDPQAKGLGEWLRSRLVNIPEELL